MEKRLFIVSNRLPVIIGEDGIKPASGGLVTAINGYLRNITECPFSSIYWAGVPGCSTGKWSEVIQKEHEKPFSYLPVFVNRHAYNGYYNGHSNSMLWPLFHYFPTYAEYNLEHYEQYLQVNELFLQTLIKHLRPADTVWIHDYHLLPLANMLRKEMPELTIGFFLHIPFPSYEIIRLMPRPWQEDMLQGMLGADLIGFHTIDYATHFLHSLQMVLGLDHDKHIVRNKGRLIKVEVFPISIDFHHFFNFYDNEKVTRLRDALRKKTHHQKIILSIDRLDYTKGVSNRLRAYEYFLQQYPEYHEKVIFVLNIVPSRDNIQQYKDRKKMIDETISRINSSIGNIHWQPVIYQYNSLSFEEMMAFYTSCDLALITPLRDGMNLVAKEFVASRKDKNGVLIISEMAGVARELTDALTINPNDIVEMANTIKTGLEMPCEEKAKRLEAMQTRIADYDVKAWAEDFLSSLENMKKKQQHFQVKLLDEYTKRNLLDHYRKADRRLLLLDYDGTLVPFSSTPGNAKPGPHLLELLHDLCNDNNDVYLVSGRSNDSLDEWFGDFNINMIAEHGAQLKYKEEEWTNELLVSTNWKPAVANLMQTYVSRCPDSFIEEKTFSIAWHYRNVEPGQSKLRAAELLAALNDHAYNRDLQVMMGNKVIEVRNRGIDKGTAVRKILARNEYDFILAIGDDTTDEDMFKVLSGIKNAYTIKVGIEASFAQYNLYTPQMVLSLLENMNSISVKQLQ